MRILCLGISHKTAPVAMREKIAFDPGSLDSALQQLRARWSEAEFLLLSTCNRTELYVVRPLHGHPREAELHDWLGEFHNHDISQLKNLTYHLSGSEAVGQLLRVASGLESLVIGEAQIVSQIKSALAAAQEACVSGPVITSLVETALHTAKHIRSETGIGQGKASVASVALEYIVEQLGNLAGRRVLSIGAGKMNELLLRQISQMQPSLLMVANRSRDKAEKLAGICNGEVVNFDSLADTIGQVDVVITSTGASDPIISSKTVAQAMDHRPSQPLLLIDLAVPHDIDPESQNIANVTLCDIDSLEDIVARTLQARQENIQHAEKTIADHIAEFMENINAKVVAPTIEALYYRVEKIIQEELAEAANKFSTHEDAPQDLEILQRSLRRALRKFCHPAAENMRNEATTGPGGVHAEIVRKLFDLDKS